MIPQSSSSAREANQGLRTKDQQINFDSRLFLDWQHAEFGNPVVMAPSKFSSTTDIYWVRFQIFF